VKAEEAVAAVEPMFSNDSSDTIKIGSHKARIGTLYLGFSRAKYFGRAPSRAQAQVIRPTEASEAATTQCMVMSSPETRALAAFVPAMAIKIGMIGYPDSRHGVTSPTWNS
jgi:hypothetical protein